MTTLICTVGGSHQPILKAIQSIAPKKVIFICSQDNEENNIKGSYISVNGKGKVNKSSFKLKDNDLPNIATLADLNDSQYQIVKVPSDGLTDCYIAIEQELNDLDHTHVICDYTGGTKTMSASMAMVAADYHLNLNIVLGTRADHIKVKDGTEESVQQDIQQLRYLRSIRQSADFWQNHHYHQAQKMAQSIPSTAVNRAGRKRFIELSKAFAAWDKFDHTQALGILENYLSIIGKHYGQLITTLKHIVDVNKSTEDKINYTPYLIYDIWNSAQRKAKQGYYDDAIARAYRMLECTAQWILLKEKGWDTSNLPDDLPADIHTVKNRQKQNQAGLYASWQLVQHFGEAQAKEFAQQYIDSMMTHIQIRNNSILAHGFTPVQKAQWNEFSQWINDHFLPMLEQQIEQQTGKKITAESQQIPQQYPQELLNKITEQK